MTLSEDEVLIYGTTRFDFPTISYNDKTFKILEERDLSELFGVSETIVDIYYVVVKNKLPLITAIIHVFVASKMISKIVVMFGITEYSYLAIRMAVCVAVFAVLYALIYKATARAYYNLVE